MHRTTIFDKEENLSTKANLVKALIGQGLFWSYDKISAENVSDRELIQKVMLYGDVPELTSLLSLYPIQTLKSEWAIFFDNNPMYKREGKFVATFLFQE
jgi:hypothetical protein